jgi:hypothetical protein
MRMSIPIRASSCTHLQCCDAMIFLMMNEKIKINVKSTNVSYAIVNLLSVCLLFYIVFCSSLFILISTYLIGLEIFHNTKKILIFQFFITQKILIFQTMVFPLLVHKIFFCDNHNEVDIIIGIIQFHFP